MLVSAVLVGTTDYTCGRSENLSALSYIYEHTLRLET